jgi:hypothetical protein
MSVSWGAGVWGATPWGGGVTPTPGANPPQIISKSPASGAIDVLESAVVAVSFFDIDYDLNTASTVIKLNGVTVYSGTSGFSTGYTGVVTTLGGVHTVQVYPILGWSYESVITAYAYIEDMGGRSVSATWSWTIRANPICYTGVAPLPIETAIQQPLTLVLDLEPARQQILNNVLKTRTYVKQSGNKAARVVYQYAFSTEISAVLNPYRLRDNDALKTTVCEKENILITDKALMDIKDRIHAGIEALYTLKVIPQQYITNFMDYLDSTLPSYRVCVVANVVTLARAYEISNT